MLADKGEHKAEAAVEALSRWQQKWRLAGSPFDLAARATIDTWLAGHAVSGLRSTGWNVGVRYLPNLGAPPVPPILPFVPFRETMDEWLRRAQTSLKAYAKDVWAQARRAGYHPEVARTEMEKHIEWYFFHVVLGQTVKSIAKATRAEESAVKSGLSEARHLLRG